MLSKVCAGATIGLDGVLIDVEVDVAGRGFPTFTLVGLPSKAVDEAKDRVRTAIVNTGYDMPDSRITVNLAPADIPKEGSSFDLPIALGMLAASGVVDREQLKDSLFIGELSLEGRIRRVPGVISLAMMAREQHLTRMFVPADNAAEAALIEGIEIYPVVTLMDVVMHLAGMEPISPFPHMEVSQEASGGHYEFDFAEVQGQVFAKRALEIAAAGMHNVHLKGVPGAGKTMLSRAFPSILPPLSREEILEVSRIYSVVGQLNGSHYMRERPFRHPHHTTSRIGLIGGGTRPAPGEISLAHRGVLFLDEFPEYERGTLEALRQPLEDGAVTISRASGSLTFPSRFLLLAASNPCPCGYLGHPTKHCRCAPAQIIKYRKKLSGPLMDRIDLHVDVAPVEEEKLAQTNPSEASVDVRGRVIRARSRAQRRLTKHKMTANGEMNVSQIRSICTLDGETQDLLKRAVSALSLSARVYFKTIKISRTIADLEGSDAIKSSHVAEALQYRVKEE